MTYLKTYKKELSTTANQGTGNLIEASAFSQSEETPPAKLSGIFSPTLVIDALGKFAAKRFRQELTVAYLQRFRDTLLSPQYAELGLLLPQTYHTLLHADVFAYADFFQSMHENAQTDLYNLPENAGNLVRKKEDEIDPQAFPVVLASLDLPRILQLRMPASNAIEFLAYRDYVYLDTDRQTLYGNTARSLGIFSKHLHSWGDSTATGWAKEPYLAQLVADKDVFNFWMALMLKKETLDLQQITITTDSGKKRLYDLLNVQLPATETYLRELIARFAETQGAAQQLVLLRDANQTTGNDRFFKYSDAVFGLLSANIRLAKALAPKDSLLNVRCDRILQYLKTGQDLVAFAQSKRFGDALSAALALFRFIYADLAPNAAPGKLCETVAQNQAELALAKEACRAAKNALKQAQKGSDEALIAKAKELVSKADAMLTAKKQTYKAFKNGNPTDLLKAAEAAAQLDKATKRQHLLAWLSRLDKYGNLLVSMANAQNSDQLLAILDRAAAPLQSYRKKRAASHFSASINLYPGLAGGVERQLETGSNKKEGTFVAFTTPLGLSLDYGTGKAGSFGVFLSLIDIGAVTAFRLKDTVSLLPELTWKNVFAPGGYLTWGIPKSPLTLGLGAQYGPALRKVDVKNSTAIEASHFRFGLSLTVDVPLLFLHSRGCKQLKWN